MMIYKIAYVSCSSSTVHNVHATSWASVCLRSSCTITTSTTCLSWYSKVLTGQDGPPIHRSIFWPKCKIQGLCCNKKRHLHVFLKVFGLPSSCDLQYVLKFVCSVRDKMAELVILDFELTFDAKQELIEYNFVVTPCVEH